MRAAISRPCLKNRIGWNFSLVGISTLCHYGEFHNGIHRVISREFEIGIKEEIEMTRTEAMTREGLEVTKEEVIKRFIQEIKLNKEVIRSINTFLGRDEREIETIVENNTVYLLNNYHEEFPEFFPWGIQIHDNTEWRSMMRGEIANCQPIYEDEYMFD